jgi:hypothetical protein
MHLATQDAHLLNFKISFFEQLTLFPNDITSTAQNLTSQIDTRAADGQKKVGIFYKILKKLPRVVVEEVVDSHRCHQLIIGYHRWHRCGTQYLAGHHQQSQHWLPVTSATDSIELYLHRLLSVTKCPMLTRDGDIKNVSKAVLILTLMPAVFHCFAFKKKFLSYSSNDF